MTRLKLLYTVSASLLGGMLRSALSLMHAQPEREVPTLRPHRNQRDLRIPFPRDGQIDAFAGRLQPAGVHVVDMRAQEEGADAFLVQRGADLAQQPVIIPGEILGERVGQSVRK